MGGIMAKRRRVETVPLATIWEIPDQAWEHVEPMLEEKYPAAPTGRPRTNFRKALDGIIFRLRTGCQWNQLPKMFGDDSSVHRWFQRWVRDGIFESLWANLLLECEELNGVNWEWQSADCCSNKARFEGGKRGPIQPIGENPEPRRACLSKPMGARLE